MTLMSTGHQIKCWVKLTRAGAHYQLGRSDRDEFVQRNLIIAVNRHVGSLKYLDASQTELKSTILTSSWVGCTRY